MPKTPTYTLITEAVAAVTAVLDIAWPQLPPAFDIVHDPRQDLRRRIIASVRQFATMPTADIEAMQLPVSELADFHTQVHQVMKAIQEAAHDDDAWAALRAGILKHQADLAKSTH